MGHIRTVAGLLQAWLALVLLLTSLVLMIVAATPRLHSSIRARVGWGSRLPLLSRVGLGVAVAFGALALGVSGVVVFFVVVLVVAAVLAKMAGSRGMI